jgi:signal transduction histidine kinase
MYSLRRRLLLVLATGFGVLTVGSGLVLSDVVAARITAEFDTVLLAKARAFVALTEQEAGQIELDYVPETMPEFERAERPEYFQYWLDDGTMLLRSRRLLVDLPRHPALAAEPRIRDVTLPDGRPGRLIELAYVPKAGGAGGDPTPGPGPEAIGPAPAGHSVILVLARDRIDADRLIAGVRTAIFGVGGVALALAVLLVWRVLVAGFRPLDLVTAQVERLDADRLGARVALPRTPSELARVVLELNRLLDRLETSLERERRFAGNVAHELRTPLAELRTLAAVGARWPEDRASVTRFFDDVEAIAGRMEGVVTDLLLLARCHAGIESVAAQTVSLGEAVSTAWSRVSARKLLGPLRTDLGFCLQGVEDVVIESDPGKLAMILTNLFGNAVSYASPNTEIRCSLRRTGARFQLEVANVAERLSPAELQRLAEPFWRKDEARSAEEHAGLGLTLVAALAALLGLEVRYAQDDDGTFRVVLTGAAQERRAVPTCAEGRPPHADRRAPALPTQGVPS